VNRSATPGVSPGLRDRIRTRPGIDRQVGDIRQGFGDKFLQGERRLKRLATVGQGLGIPGCPRGRERLGPAGVRLVQVSRLSVVSG